MVSQLLPPNSTALERALASVLPRQSLDALADAPAWHEGNAPEAYLPWLAAEYGLGEFTEYFLGTRELLAAGKPWLRLRGTAAAVKLALSWIGMPGRVEQDGTLLQIDPGSPEAPANLVAIRQLVGASVPAHVELYRLYHGYDRRVLHASLGGRWSDAFLSDDSGVWIDGVKLSFGRTQRLTAERPETAGILRIHRIHAALILYPDVLRWGTMRFGDAPVLNHPVVRGRLVGMANPLALLDPVTLQGRRRIARAAFPLSEDARLGQPSTRFGGYIETAHNRFYWSDPDSMLSAFDPGRTRTPIEEVWVIDHPGAATTPADFGQQGGQRTGRHGLHTSRADWRGQVRMDGSLRWSDARLTEHTGSQALHRVHAGVSTGLGERASRYTWTGGWDNRRWGGDISITHQTLTS